jgi:two-component system, OmpR family, sensor kinase
MIRLRSVGTRLSLALLVIVAAGLTFVYMIVVPSLEDRLVDGKLDQLEAVGRPAAVRLRSGFDDEFVRSVSAGANARVLVVQRFGGDVLQVTDDSGGEEAAPSQFVHDPVALEAIKRGNVVRDTVSRAGDRFAEVAVPVDLEESPLRVVLLSASLRDQLETVDLVERRLLIAGVLALVGALVLGYGGSWLFARRLRRLERGAERIAAGHFDEPVVDRRHDEIGELAAAFDRMRRRLAQLDHARREFVANASHELRTPLFSIAGSLELLAEEDLDEATRAEFIATMREQVERLSRLAADLLDLSRLDAGRIVAETETLDLDAIAQTLAEEFRAVAQASDHRLEVDGAEGVRAVGDQQWVLRAGRALVENALVHTPPGTTVRLLVSHEGDFARLTVEDDGPGIPPDQLAHVFERFYRVDGARASGSGLGLAIARELAQLMGGTVEGSSTERRTTFTILLPTKARGNDDRADPHELLSVKTT